jgi:hypothetical protein
MSGRRTDGVPWGLCSRQREVKLAWQLLGPTWGEGLEYRGCWKHWDRDRGRVYATSPTTTDRAIPALDNEQLRLCVNVAKLLKRPLPFFVTYQVSQIH